jgi:hypothetical protein
MPQDLGTSPNQGPKKKAKSKYFFCSWPATELGRARDFPDHYHRQKTAWFKK